MGERTGLGRGAEGEDLNEEKVQTGVRMEKCLVKVLKAPAELRDLSLGDRIVTASTMKVPRSPATRPFRGERFARLHVPPSTLPSRFMLTSWRQGSQVVRVSPQGKAPTQRQSSESGASLELRSGTRSAGEQGSQLRLSRRRTKLPARARR